MLPVEEYEKKTDSVLAWKKTAKLGRFDPNAPSHEQAKIDAIAEEIEARGIAVGKASRGIKGDPLDPAAAEHQVRHDRTAARAHAVR